MSSDAQYVNGLEAPVLFQMRGVTPKSEKVPVLVLHRLIRSQVGLDMVGLLYRDPFFCGRFASLARWNSHTNYCQFLFILSRPLSSDWAHLNLTKAKMCDA